jgi:transposase-like protein
MAIKTSPKKGRPEAVIDWKRVDSMLQAHCTGTGIASLLGIHPETLYRACQDKYKIGFTEYSVQKKTEGKELLRQKQFSVAMNGEKSMLIWLGKQYLEQSDKLETIVQNVEVPEDEVIEAALQAALKADKEALDKTSR